MKDIYLIMPGDVSKQLENMVEAVVENMDIKIIRDSNNLPDLTYKKIVFAVELNQAGYNIGLIEILSKLYEKGQDALLGSTAVVLIHSPNDLYTKSMAQNIIFLANKMGCAFPGHPVVEAIDDLTNFKTWQKKLDKEFEEICFEVCKRLRKNLLADRPKFLKKPKILALHASSFSDSNTLMLWNMVKKHIEGCIIKEQHVENGTITDCLGCSYKTCKHYSKRKSCFYGGAIIKEILPAIEEANVVVWICPNYNDAISAKLMAVINRMTVLYRRTKFYDKTMFGVIVSGNSGCDSVAKQLIGALNINKSFRLPPYFSISAIANDPGEIMEVKDIEIKAKNFAQNIMTELKAGRENLKHRDKN